jgi:chemotaxis protein methyltransferase CheR
LQVSDHIYKFFADYIFDKTGITYTEKDYYRLDSRFKSLLEVFELDSVDALYDKYKSGISPDMHAVLINFSTNNETFFFRDNKPFKVLTKVMMPELKEMYTMGNINLWSCASSTGQEALSILMQLSDKDPEGFKRIQIDGTDISKEALEKARKGIYTGLDIQRGLPITTLMKYFEQQEDENWKVSSDLLNKIRYGEFNLLTDRFKENHYHIIFCRNVLIYQTKENKEAILRNLYNALRPGGFMVLGSGESLIGMKLDFDKETHDGLTVYRRKKEG